MRSLSFTIFLWPVSPRVFFFVWRHHRPRMLCISFGFNCVTGVPKHHSFTSFTFKDFFVSSRPPRRNLSPRCRLFTIYNTMPSSHFPPFSFYPLFLLHLHFDSLRHSLCVVVSCTGHPPFTFFCFCSPRTRSHCWRTLQFTLSIAYIDERSWIL